MRRQSADLVSPISFCGSKTDIGHQPVYDRKAYEQPDDIYDVLKRPLGTLLADGNILPFSMPDASSAEKNVTGKKRAHQTVCKS